MSRVSQLIDAVVESATTAALDGSYTASETETRRYPAPSGLEVETVNGTVAVRGEDRDDVGVVVTKRATDEAALQRARAVASGGDAEPLALRGEFDGSPTGVAVDFEVALPADVPVESVETKNGSIELADVTGDARLAAKNGSITAEGVAGYLDLRTANGSITATDVAGVDRAASTNGRIELELDDVRTDASVETTSGAVTVLAGPELDADVTLSTALGRVDAPPLGGSRSDHGGATIGGTIGEGGHPIRVETEVGSVEFRRRSSEASPNESRESDL